MYENSNKGIVKDIAKGTMKVHRLRNVMACLAIALTAILITLVCGAGVSTVQALMTEAQMNRLRERTARGSWEIRNCSKRYVNSRR